jgi:hypothetical protein
MLSAEQLAEVLELIKGADSVELKLTVPDTDSRSAMAALGMDPLDAEIRQIAFFDTPDLALHHHGLVVRARRIQRKPGDAVVKLRPVAPDKLAPALRKSRSFGVEVDAMPGGFVCSASMKSPLDAKHVKELLADRRPLRKLLSKKQRSFFAAHAPDTIGLEDLSLLGPINILKLKYTPPEYSRRLVAELWFYPDGTRILELSTKAAPHEAFEVAAETKAYLGTRGIDLLGEQQTKTKTTLEYFARELDRETSANS